MKFFVGILVAALSHAVSCGNVAVRMPYGSPAGVTYVDSTYHAGLAAGPIAYSAPAAALPLSAPAPLAATAYAAVPTVQHVPGVADVPVTRYEAQPGVIQNVVDVAKPAVQTRRFEIRRPAIQKQFYDIEERVVVRPAGSAVVELDEPVSRRQKGPAVIQPAAVGVPTYGVSVTPSPIAPVGISAVQGTQIFGSQGVASTPAPAPVFEQEQTQESFSDEDSVSIENPDISLRSSLARTSGPSTPAPYPRYERPEPQPALTASPARGQFQARSQPQVRLFTPQQSLQSSQSYEASQARAFEAAQSRAFEAAQSRAYEAAQARSYEAAQGRSFEASQTYGAPRAYDSRASTAPRTFDNSAQTAAQSYSSSQTAAIPQSYSASQVAQYSTSQSFGPAPVTVTYQSPQALAPQARFAQPAIPSARNYQGPEVSHVNQQRLIELLTARGGVAEIGFARSGASISSAGESGQVRGRVVSATPAPAYSQPAGERVNTRRVVVSRPIETLQEVEVAEPVTKFERIQVNQPTLIKTARQDLLRVPTSVPVYGKALAPVAQAALPLAYSAAAHAPWQ